jgi:hypothetical protein
MTEDEARELQQLPLWDKVKEELMKRIEATRNDMEYIGGSEVEKCQERIRTLREVMRLPDDVVDREALG